MKKPILIVDNMDSFTYNLKELVVSLGYEANIVSSIGFDESLLDDYEKVIISPGPLLPKDFPAIQKILNYAENKIKEDTRLKFAVLGICLGHQAIVEYFGGRLQRLNNPLHGKISSLSIIKKDSLFKNIDENINVAHYHSWIGCPDFLPSCLEILATSVIKDDHQNPIIMAVKHRDFSIFGVQFHPESIVTEGGREILKNFLDYKN